MHKAACRRKSLFWLKVLEGKSIMTGGVEAGSRSRKLRNEICNQKLKEEI